VADQVQRLARGLVGAGVGRGAHVALLASNRPEWVVVCLAVLKAGATIMPLDTQIANEALEHVLRDSEARYIFTTTSYLNRLKRMELDVELRPILLDVEPDDERGWRALLNDTTQELPTVEPEEQATLFYTSGTTGLPKGVPLTHQNLVFQLQSVHQTPLVSERDRVIQPLPFFHVYPFTIGLLIPLSYGMPIVMPHSLARSHLAQAISEGKPTVMIGVPRLYRALYSGIESQFESRGKLANTWFQSTLKLCTWLRTTSGMRAGKVLLSPIHQRFGKQFRMVASGGSALDPELATKLDAIGWQVAIGYGLTETSPLLTIKMPDPPKLASVGPAIPGVDIRIDPDYQREGDGEDIPPPPEEGKTQQEGEILVRGPSVFTGYRNMPEQSEKVITSDGWFRTGDLGYFDADNYLHISGRASTLIVTEGGKNVQPEPVEDTYQLHPFIKEIGILQHDNRLAALVVPEMDEVNRQRNGDVEGAIREAMREQSRQVASYQRVADYATTPETLPRTNLGKIRRHKLAELYDLAKQGITPTTEATTGPIPIEDMSESDRGLLEHPAARQVWDWLANRYDDRRLTPDTNPQMDLGIDSLSWLNLVMDIRERTGVELGDEALKRINTVRDLLQEVTNASEQGGGASLGEVIESPEQVISAEKQQWLKPRSPFMEGVGVVVFFLLKLLFRLLFRLRVHGLDNLPKEGAFVLTPNHTSYFDAPSVAAALDYAQIRRIYWAGSVDVMFAHPIMRFISRMSQTMPVAGEATGTGLASLAFAAITVKRNHSLVWFPEGRISTSGDMLPFRQGIGIVLEHYQVPVVPVYIQGTSEALPEGRTLPRLKPITITFGKACDPSELAQQGSGDSAPARIANALHERVLHLRSQQEQEQEETQAS
jgi:long-chain acyl-CoA synthetase